MSGVRGARHDPAWLLNKRRRVSSAAEPFDRVLNAEQANIALAQFADRMQPAFILLLVDQVLQLVVAGSRLNGESMWVIGLISNSLGVLASMQGQPEPTYIYMEVVMRKAIRHNITLSALALKLYRNELLIPLLNVGMPLEVAMTRTPVWRVHLGNVVSLSQCHSYEAVLRFADSLAEKEAVELWGQGEGSCCTPLRRVRNVVEHVLDWWRQPPAQSILARVPEATLWHAFFHGVAAAAALHEADVAAGKLDIAQVCCCSRSPTSASFLAEMADVTDIPQLFRNYRLFVPPK